ncbi:hypothetical protein H0X48_06915 [Candidatus Dependentiae bacterium]|nr:hypothetical protein [Candidatus Dependentiae bacterium]
MKSRLLYIFLSSMSLSAVYANTELVKAVKQLDLNKVECELKKGEPLTLAQKNELIKELYSTMEQSKQKQLTWDKYLNKNTVIGSLSLALCLAFSITAAIIRPKYSDSSEIKLPRTKDLSFSGELDEEENEHRGNTLLNALNQGYKTGFAEGIKKGLVQGICGGTLITASGLIAAHQLYKSFTGQHLKENYKSTLAIKQLLESTPVNNNEQPAVV